MRGPCAALQSSPPGCCSTAWRRRRRRRREARGSGSSTASPFYADHLPQGGFDQEVRAEFEPNFHGRIGPILFNDRNRIEYRWRTSGDRGRYRNQLRVSYAPVGARLQPFLWNELLCDLQAGCTENRMVVGLGIALGATVRLDLGYLLRSREREAGWQSDHYGSVYLFVGLPKAR